MLYIASDHAGFELKAKLVAHFSKTLGATNLQDLGTNSKDSVDYPMFAAELSEKILKNKGSLGILICGTGIGMSIAANKIKGIRAAAVSEIFSAQMAREHNDAQVLCLGARVVDEARAIACVDAFLKSSFDTSNPRHARRVEQMARLDKGERIL